MRVTTILNPRDFSEPSAEAHATACDVARRHQARLICLHVAEKPVVSYIERASELSSEEFQQKLWEALRWPKECEKDLDVEHRVVEGDPVKQILSMATETDCDLIVMGTRGITGLSRWFTSSVTEAIVRDAPCSVLVARSPDETVA